MINISMGASRKKMHGGEGGGWRGECYTEFDV